MKKSHAGFWVGVAVLFAAAVYSALLFLIKTKLDMSAWVLYGATMVAFLLFALQAVASARRGAGIVLDTALGVVTAIYFGIQLVLGGIVCMSFHGLPLTPVVVCELLLLAAYLVVAFMTYAAQSSNAAQDRNDREAVQKLRLLESDVRGMADGASDPETRRALQKLAEAIHYSDVASLPALADVEDRIARSVDALKSDLSDGDADPLERIEAIHRLLRERDRTAAIMK